MHALALTPFGLMASGCVVAGPSEFENKQQTPPVLDLNQADPPLSEVLNKKSDDIISFKVPVRSEDLGEGLFAGLYTDWGLPSRQLRKFTDVPAGTFDQTQDRNVSLSFGPLGGVLNKGCNQLTLIVTHTSNFVAEPRDPSDLAIATWWVNLDDEEPATNLIGECPTGAGGQP